MTGLFEPDSTLIFQDLVSSRMKVDSLLNSNLQEGIQFFEKHAVYEAMICFHKIIDFEMHDHVNNLSINERKLVALALTYVADIERIGTEADEDKALKYLEEALELSPNLEKAEKKRCFQTVFDRILKNMDFCFNCWASFLPPLRIYFLG